MDNSFGPTSTLTLANRVTADLLPLKEIAFIFHLKYNGILF